LIFCFLFLYTTFYFLIGFFLCIVSRFFSSSGARSSVSVLHQSFLTKTHSLIKSNLQNQGFSPHEPEFVNKGIANGFNPVDPSLFTDNPPAEIAIPSESCQGRYGKIPLDTPFCLGASQQVAAWKGLLRIALYMRTVKWLESFRATRGYGKTSGVRGIWFEHFFLSPPRRRGGCYFSGSKRAKVPWSILKK